MLSAENKKERDKNDTKFLCISNYTLPAMNYQERFFTFISRLELHQLIYMIIKQFTLVRVHKT